MVALVEGGGDEEGALKYGQRRDCMSVLIFRKAPAMPTALPMPSRHVWSSWSASFLHNCNHSFTSCSWHHSIFFCYLFFFTWTVKDPGYPRTSFLVESWLSWGRAWWLMSIILATWEAEIRRITVQSHPKTNSLWDPISKIPNTKYTWWSGSRGRLPASKHEALSSNPSTGKKKKAESWVSWWWKRYLEAEALSLLCCANN
jgi:hypothetical protein